MGNVNVKEEDWSGQPHLQCPTKVTIRSDFLLCIIFCRMQINKKRCQTRHARRFATWLALTHTGQGRVESQRKSLETVINF